MQLIKVDRSRIESFEKCPAQRFWEYEYISPFAPTQIGGVQKSLPVLYWIVGGAVHKGLEYLLLGKSENQAAATGLNEYTKLFGSFEIPDIGKMSEPQPPPSSLGDFNLFSQLPVPNSPTSEFESKLGSELKPEDEDLFSAAGPNTYSILEGAAMVEALIRCYANAPTGIKWLLKEYEVVSIEEEIEWSMKEMLQSIGYFFPDEIPDVIVMSRPDGVLRHRVTKQLFALSFKTAKTLDYRIINQLKYDNQGISEMLAIESKYKESCAGVQMVYLLKGLSTKDEFDNNQYKSSSPLIRPYCLQGPTPNDNLYAPQYRWTDETGKTKQVTKGYKRTNIWGRFQPGVEKWGKTLQQQFPKVYSDQIINLPATFRNQLDTERWLNTNFNREIKVAAATMELNVGIGSSVLSPNEKMNMLDARFPMNRKNCAFPSPCGSIPLCHNGLGLALLDGAPLEELGLKVREPNHPTESPIMEKEKNV